MYPKDEINNQIYSANQNNGIKTVGKYNSQ